MTPVCADAAEGTAAARAGGLIAAAASRLELIQVTGNVRDFTPFAGLVIENWFEP